MALPVDSSHPFWEAMRGWHFGGVGEPGRLVELEVGVDGSKRSEVRCGLTCVLPSALEYERHPSARQLERWAAEQRAWERGWWYPPGVASYRVAVRKHGKGAADLQRARNICRNFGVMETGETLRVDWSGRGAGCRIRSPEFGFVFGSERQPSFTANRHWVESVMDVAILLETRRPVSLVRVRWAERMCPTFLTVVGFRARTAVESATSWAERHAGVRIDEVTVWAPFPTPRQIPRRPSKNASRKKRRKKTRRKTRIEKRSGVESPRPTPLEVEELELGQTVRLSSGLLVVSSP